MEDLRIEKKKPIWPLIVTVVSLLALIVYLIFESGKTKIHDEAGIDTEETLDVHEQKKNNGSDYTKSDLEVAEYNSFINDKRKLGNDIKYTKDALVQLANAVRQAATEHNLNIEEQLDKIKYGALSVQKSDDSLLVAQNIKMVGGEIALVMERLQKNEFPDLSHESEKIKRALDNIAPDVEISRQQERIIAFFESCGDALKKMELTPEAP